MEGFIPIPGQVQAARRRTGRMDARQTGQTLAPCASRAGDRLHAQALEWLHTLPRRRARLITNNAAERALRGLARRRTRPRIPDTPQSRLSDLLPWDRRRPPSRRKQPDRGPSPGVTVQDR